LPLHFAKMFPFLQKHPMILGTIQVALEKEEWHIKQKTFFIEKLTEYSFLVLDQKGDDLQKSSSCLLNVKKGQKL
jgi:hypothetical protein